MAERNARSYAAPGWERAAPVLTSILVVALVAYVVVRNEPFADPNLVVLIRVILSLSTAVLGATIPGFLRVDWKLRGGLMIRAGGALALFVLTFVFTPSVLTPLGDPLVWRMPENQMERLDNVLKQVPPESRFKVRLLLLPASAQSHTFGDDLSKVLHHNGFDGERVTDFTLDADLDGLSVIVPNGTKRLGDIPPQTRQLMALLDQAGIPYILRPPGTSTVWDTPAIVVGMKPVHEKPQPSRN